MVNEAAGLRSSSAFRISLRPTAHRRDSSATKAQCSARRTTTLTLVFPGPRASRAGACCDSPRARCGQVAGRTGEKVPDAPREFPWQWVFPATRLWIDPVVVVVCEGGIIWHESVIQTGAAGCLA